MLELAVMNTFTEWLNQELNSRGWSQSELARRARLAPATISNIMNEYKTPGLESCRKIARAFDLPQSVVLQQAGLGDEQMPIAPGEARLLWAFRRMTDEMRQILITVASGMVGEGSASQVNDAQMAYEVREPRTIVEWMASEIERGITELDEEDVRRLFDLMKRLRGDEEASDGARREVGADS